MCDVDGAAIVVMSVDEDFRVIPGVKQGRVGKDADSRQLSVLFTGAPRAGCDPLGKYTIVARLSIKLESAFVRQGPRRFG